MKEIFSRRLRVTPLVFSVLFIFASSNVYADQTVITNTISASSNSGGNTAESGEIIEGETKNSVHIETVINGDVVTDIEEESDEPIFVNQEVSATAGDEEHSVSTQEPITLQEGHVISEIEEIVDIQEELEEKKGVLGYISNLLTYVFSFFRI